MPDVPFHGDIGPPLDGAASRWSEAELRGMVANAKMTFDGTFMPAFYKTEGFVRPGAAIPARPLKAICPRSCRRTAGRGCGGLPAHPQGLTAKDLSQGDIPMKLSRRNALWVGLAGLPPPRSGPLPRRWMN
jgi:hypothetical protein